MPETQGLLNAVYDPTNRALRMLAPLGTYESPSTALMDRLRQRRIGHMNVGKASFSIRHDDFPDSDFAIYTLEQARGIISTWGVPAAVVGAAGKGTLNQLRTMLQNGNEVGLHSNTHPTTTKALLDVSSEITTARAALEALDPLIRAELWVTPGTVTDLFTVDSDWAASYGKAVRATYIAGTGFTWAMQHWRSNQEFYGVSPNAIDDATVWPLANIKAKIDEAVATGSHIPFSLHTWNIDTAGQITTTNYTAVLDYLKAYMDAGQIENLTVTGGMFATPWGDWEDIVEEGDFQGLPYTSSTWGPWLTTGTPTLKTDGGPGGPNYVEVNLANHISQSHYQVSLSDAEKAHYRFRCKIKNSASGLPNVLLQDSTTPANWKVDYRPTVANDGAWHTVSQAVTIPAGLDRVSVVLTARDSNLVDYADVEMKRI